MVFLAFLACHGLVCSQSGLISVTTECGVKVDVPVSEFISIIHQKKLAGDKLSATEALYLKAALVRAKEEALRKKAHDDLVRRVGDIESSMEEKGYVTFVHGRNWEWNFVNDIWNFICAVHHGYNVMSGQISLRYRDDDCDIDQLYKYRKQLLRSGSSFHVGSATDCKGKESEITFMSRTILSHGEYTANYFWNGGKSWGDQGLKVAKDLLKEHGLSQCIPACEQLYKLHKQSSDLGEMLCICVHEDHINDLVYVAEYGGFKHKTKLSCLEQVKACQQQVANIDNDYIDNHTDDVSSIYCFAVTDIPGEAKGKYTIKSVAFTKEKRYQEYKEELAKLFQAAKAGQYVVQGCDKDDTTEGRTQRVTVNLSAMSKFAESITDIWGSITDYCEDVYDWVTGN